MNHPFISVISPVYGCKSCLYELCFRLKETLEKITQDFEIILVNDASPDGAWETIIELAQKDSRVKGINLSRNFGQHYAITAGLDYCKGEWVVVMDCDLQDQPEEILKFYYKTKEGFDIVFGKRIKRRDNLYKRVTSMFFYKIFDYFTEQKSDPSVANFGIYNKKVIEYYKKMQEQSRTFPLFIRWLGFKSEFIEIEHAPRKEGESAYTFPRLFNLAIDAIISQSNKPLKLSIKFGFLLSLGSFIYGVFLIIRYFIYNVPLGWTSIMVAIFFIGGLLFANLGLLGLYIGKIFNEVKNRPLYAIKDIININFEENGN
ncbi:MAG: glycosyltransferase family 2 protein [Bacteroidales bacterium]